MLLLEQVNILFPFVTGPKLFPWQSLHLTMSKQLSELLQHSMDKTYMLDAVLWRLTIQRYQLISASLIFFSDPQISSNNIPNAIFKHFKFKQHFNVFARGIWLLRSCRGGNVFMRKIILKTSRFCVSLWRKNFIEIILRTHFPSGDWKIIQSPFGACLKKVISNPEYSASELIWN